MRVTGGLPFDLRQFLTADATALEGEQSAVDLEVASEQVQGWPWRPQPCRCDDADFPEIKAVRVRQAGQASWLMSIDEPQNLALGLFIRDVAALSSVHTWLPAAAPVVRSTGGGGSPAAARQWDAWWDQALAVDPYAPWPKVTTSWWTPPDFGSLDAAPQLQALVRRHFLAAVRWSEDRKREHIAVMTDPGRSANETRLVADLERACGRRAAPFNLRVTEIPVAGRELWHLHPGHVVVTAGLLGDPGEYRRRLTPVLQALL